MTAPIEGVDYSAGAIPAAAASRPRRSIRRGRRRGRPMSLLYAVCAAVLAGFAVRNGMQGHTTWAGIDAGLAVFDALACLHVEFEESRRCR